MAALPPKIKKNPAQESRRDAGEESVETTRVMDSVLRSVFVNKVSIMIQLSQQKRGQCPSVFVSP